MREAARLGKPIVAHCEVNSLLHGGYIHDGEYARLHGHRGICSESEWKQVERDIELVRRTGCRYHVCHVSTRESVELVRRAKAEGLPVSCETAPHYLVLTEDDLREDGSFKMNPPLRTQADRQALIEGILDGTVDMIATDHAPHTAEEKARDFAKAPSGITGLETAFSVCNTYLVKTGRLTRMQLLEKMSKNPAEVYGLTGRAVREGNYARLVLLDWDSEKIYSEYKSKGINTPYTGEKLTGSPRAIVTGEKITE